MSAPRRYTGLLILGSFVAFVGGWMVWDALRPTGGPSPDLEARLRCIARAVALQQALDSASPLFAEADALTNDVYPYIRRMQQADDPRRLFYRPIMIEEETARDAAMASDADGYITTTWAEVQDCATRLGLRRQT